jgi:hypothetical protein
MSSRLATFCLVSLTSALTACPHPDPQVTYLGRTKYPPNPEGCGLEVLTGSQPDIPVESIATVDVRCSTTERGECFTELRREACKAGGEVVFAVAERGVGRELIVTATIGRHTSAAMGPPKPTVGAPAQWQDDCDPVCSPGFGCEKGVCVPKCNPACTDGMKCGQDRLCHPAS